MNPQLYYLAAQQIPGLGSKTFRALLKQYGDNILTLFQAPEEELCRFSRVTPEIAARIREASENPEPYKRMLLEMEEQGVWLACWEDSTYPPLLRRLEDPPLLLYLRGQWEEADNRSVALVGSREASPAGRELAAQLAAAFAKRGLTVVSGFARGIDTAAHRGALEGGGRTIAVFGTGIDRLHPPSNRELAERIVQRRQGLLLTEFPPATLPQGRTLMARDRIISGLSRAVIVVEAGLQSGSMDTAKRARRQELPLYAVDWSGTAVSSEGTAYLICNHGQALPPRCDDIDFERLVAEILREPSSASAADSAGPQLTLFS